MCYNARYIQLSKKNRLTQGKSNIKKKKYSVFYILQMSGKYSYNFGTLFQINFCFIVYFYTLDGVGDLML